MGKERFSLCFWFCAGMGLVVFFEVFEVRSILFSMVLSGSYFMMFLTWHVFNLKMFFLVCVLANMVDLTFVPPVARQLKTFGDLGSKARAMNMAQDDLKSHCRRGSHEVGASQDKLS